VHLAGSSYRLREIAAYPLRVSLTQLFRATLQGEAKNYIESRQKHCYAPANSNDGSLRLSRGQRPTVDAVGFVPGGAERFDEAIDQDVIFEGHAQFAGKTALERLVHQT